jgi:oligoendopeptidase F
VKKYQGHLGDGPSTFIEAMQFMDALAQRAMKIQVYATMSSAVDTADQAGAAMSGKAMSALAQLGAATSFVDPELLSIGEAKLRQWLAEDQFMSMYEHYINDLFRRQAHVRNAEVEELLGMLRDPFGTVRTTAHLLANADFQFKPAKDSKGKKVALTQSTYDAILNTSDRKARQTAWENYTDKYLEFKNTLGSNLAASIKQNVFNMKARKVQLVTRSDALQRGRARGDVPQPAGYLQEEPAALAQILAHPPQGIGREGTASV